MPLLKTLALHIAYATFTMLYMTDYDANDTLLKMHLVFDMVNMIVTTDLTLTLSKNRRNIALHKSFGRFVGSVKYTTYL